MVFSLKRQEKFFKYGNHNNEEEHDKGNLTKVQSKAADDHSRNVTCPWTLVQSSTCTPKPRSDLANLVVLAPPLLKPKLQTVSVWWSMNYSCSRRQSPGLLLQNIFNSNNTAVHVQHRLVNPCSGLKSTKCYMKASWQKEHKMKYISSYLTMLSLSHCPNRSRRYCLTDIKMLCKQSTFSVLF